MSDKSPPGAIAIVGMSGRFPGAASVEELWEQSVSGQRGIRALTDQELSAAGVTEAARRDPHYVKVGAPLADVELFDAEFFGIPPTEADAMDPQHRLFLECAWEALERAGHAVESHRGAIGVYAGAAHEAASRPLATGACFPPAIRRAGLAHRRPASGHQARIAASRGQGP